ncbi:4'-phosphopantetheinyl transferase family protein [Modicisalibacter radicis]|uniref:4'-phosphopantetheinyl transferase family protein n=1 Tax=Halomonas sp. EAR18 TaxID=2518972 RepID=UPI0014447E08|nr:4'-phosphopantetheinyl transferase superfamily protein [Halomonas sp. EAR18]
MQRLSLPESVPAGVEVWQLALDLDAPAAADDYRLMSVAELQRVRRLRNPADVVRSVTTRAGLRRLMACRMGVAADELTFTENAYGKPRLGNGDGPAFNVSHAGEYALIALAPCGEIGIDIERRQPDADLAALVAWVLSPREQRDHASGKAALPFIERWVVKEAALKALGVGIGDHLQALSVAPAPPRRHGYRIDLHLSIPIPVTAWALHAPTAYVAALAHADLPPGGLPSLTFQETHHV